jgi:O-acetyl-ADP-ribose deacetylase
LLARCHRRAVEVADGLGVRTISFPAISCGAYRFPPALAAPVALESAWQAASQSASVRELSFVLFHERMRDLFTLTARRLGLEST